MRSSKNTLKWLRWKYNGYARMNDLLLLSKCPLYSHYFLDLMGLSMDLQAHWQNWLLLLCVSHPYMTHGAGARATYVACPCRTCGTPWNTSYEDHNFPLDSNVRKWELLLTWRKELSKACWRIGLSWPCWRVELSRARWRDELSTLKGQSELVMLKGRDELFMLNGRAELSTLKGRAELSTLKGQSKLVMLKGQDELVMQRGPAELSTLKGRDELVMMKGRVEHIEGTSWAELVMLKGRAEHAEGMSWVGHAERWSSRDLNTQVELDMLNSQCIVNSMWYSPLYQSTVDEKNRKCTVLPK